MQTLRGDRIFRAGATPGSAEETHLWIVDYKTARHGASGLDAFLAERKGKVSAATGSLMPRSCARFKEKALPLRMALYYPTADQAGVVVEAR